MAARRRLTVALVLTGAVADEIDGLRRGLGAKALERIAPHCTIVPPVNVREDCLEEALAVARGAAAKSPPIVVDLGPVSTFWPRTPVLYLAVRGDVSSIASLRSDLATGPLAPPTARREREFVPHVTLDQKIEPSRLQHAMAALGDYRTSFCFERLTVLEQDDGHRWQPLADSPFGKPRVAGRGSLDLEISVVDRSDPFVAAWAEKQWEQYSRERYGETVRPVTPFAVVARADNAPVGFADGAIWGQVCRLGQIIVSPQWRGQGVGLHVLDAVERTALERRCTRVRLETLAGGAAQSFYAGLGYRVTARLPRWREERDFVVMERELVIASRATADAGRAERDRGTRRTAGN